ncbi:hypothetical protein C9374_002770 [Naegleria lovaniensis]|uniref:Membrane insertase YidC/Oxa/ALB C-terminal domain-containing protein n=1 Tax=Naegleria lovaniensis TaxID=51637 RepID=A0AA88GUD2_NAELO|nr:uncharacterized protein C9374_002770 [Naegleria lovaniensis]KAG2386324.1 hypothetical protein C9374_002770 [Naegleria lovaniensis]
MQRLSRSAFQQVCTKQQGSPMFLLNNALTRRMPSSSSSWIGTATTFKGFSHHDFQESISRCFSVNLVKRNVGTSSTTEGTTHTTTSNTTVQSVETPASNTTATATSTTTQSVPQKPVAFEEPLHEKQSFNLDDFEDDVAGQQLEAAESMSSLFSSFTDYINPSKILEACIVALHDAGCPWWSSIALVGFGLRMLMSPLNIMSMRASTIMSKLGNSFTQLKKDQVDPKKSPTEREYARRAYDEMAKKEGFKMSHMFLPLIQSPLFIAFFFCLNRMAREVEGFQWGGMLWFTDLTVKDPTYVLPILSASCFMAVFLVNTFLRNAGSGRLQSLIAVGMGIFSFALVPFTGRLPAALFMYWIPSNIFQIIFYLLMSRKPIKRYFKIPEVDTSKGANKGMDKIEKMIEKFMPAKAKSPVHAKLMTKQDFDRSRAAKH